MIDLWQEIYGTIKRNKLRTFLTGFAVAWGIFMLIVLLGAGNGIIHAFEQNASERALNSIRLGGGWTTQSYEGLKEGRRIQLENKDLAATEKYFPDNIITAGATLRQGDVNISFGQEYINISLMGVHPNYVESEAIKTASGRFINRNDVKERRKVIILHKKSAEILFGKSRTEPVGQFVNAGGVAYRVVGLYEDQGDQSSLAFIPFSTMQTIYNKGDKLNNIIFTTKNLTSEAANETFEKEYRKVIAANHRFDPEDEGAIWIWNRFTQSMQMDTGITIIHTALWIIGLFTLLSGIVGVSNIMLITVKERTREFGIRKAIGATPWSILKLIIVESVIITTFFGYIGMVLGVAANEYMDATIGHTTVNSGIFEATIFLNPTVGLGVCIEATLVMIIAGTVAGLVPARKAAMIRPIEALRAE